MTARTTGGSEVPGRDLGIPGFGPAREIGRGGFGVVYRCEEPMFGRTVAVKVLAGAARDAVAQRRFAMECRAMGVLSGHPHIVTVYGGGFLPDGDAYLVMDLLPHGSLADLVARAGPVHPCHVLELGVMLAGALESAHRAGFLHRDLKPENVLISDYGEAELADFGIAVLADAPRAPEVDLAATVVHLAPEAVGGAPPSVASDLYALGSTLYVALAGAPPFVRATDTSLAEVRQRIVSQPVPDLRRHGVPDPVARVVEATLAKDPRARPPSAAALGQVLRDVQRRLGYERTPLRITPDATAAAIAAARDGR